MEPWPDMTVISPNFLVCIFCAKAQFPQSFGRIVQNFAEAMPFCKISTPGNQMKLPNFTLWLTITMHDSHKHQLQKSSRIFKIQEHLRLNFLPK